MTVREFWKRKSKAPGFILMERLSPKWQLLSRLQLLSMLAGRRIKDGWPIRLQIFNWRKQCSYFFQFWPLLARNGNFSYFAKGGNDKKAVSDTQGPKLKKVRPLCFLKLQKLKRTKWSYFFQFWPLGAKNGLLSFLLNWLIWTL